MSAWYFCGLRPHNIIIFSYHLTLIHVSLLIKLWNFVPCPYAPYVCIGSLKRWSCQELKTWKKNRGDKCLTRRCCTNVAVLVYMRTIKFLCFLPKCTQHSAVLRLGVFIYRDKEVLQVYRNFLCNRIYAQQFYINISRAVKWHGSKERHSLTVFPSWHCALFQN